MSPYWCRSADLFEEENSRTKLIKQYAEFLANSQTEYLEIYLRKLEKDLGLDV